MRIRFLGLIVVAGLALAACTSAQTPETESPAGPAPAAELAAYYNQTLDWKACGSAECATLLVPKDYADPELGDFEIALLRQVAKGDGQGSLVLNPGGPGGSGVDYAAAADAVLTPDVTDAFDIVGFDPRGVGKSSPIKCLTDAQKDEWIAADGKPDSAAEAETLVADAAEYGVRCAENAAGFYEYMSTDAVVKDLDVLRAALGETQLDYLGKSYGTLIGALYIEQFADNVGRFVLDGVLPPDLDAAEIGLGQAEGFEDSLRRYVADCQKQADCPLAKGSVDEGVAQIQTFIDKLAETPLPTDSDRELTQSLGLGSILNYLYFPDFGDWDQLSAGLRDGLDGDGSTLLDMYDERLQRSADGKYADNSQESFYAVSCLDRPVDADIATLEARESEWAASAPTFGPYLAWSDVVCGQWPVNATGEPVEVTTATQTPVLVVSTTHDPATPLAWAQQLAEALPGARLVTYDADGHTAYGNRSGCVDDVVDAYLVNGDVPAEDVTCP